MSSVFDKLDAVIRRNNEIEETMARPEVAVDFERVQELAKERASLEGLVEISRRHQNLAHEREGLEELLRDERDQELAESLFSQLQAVVRADYLIAHFAPGSFHYRVLKQWGFKTLPRKGIDFTVKALSPSLPLRPEIFENWNLSLGDLEYF